MTLVIFRYAAVAPLLACFRTNTGQSSVNLDIFMGDDGLFGYKCRRILFFWSELSRSQDEPDVVILSVIAPIESALSPAADCV